MVFKNIPFMTRVTAAQLAVAAFLASPAIGQEVPSVKLGEADFFPSVGLSFINNNNAYLTPDDEVESTGFVVAPSFEIVANRRLLEITGTYQGSYATYSEDNLDYDDHSLQIGASAELGSRKRLSGFAQLSKNHQTLGTGLTRGIANQNTEQIEIADFSLGGSFIYGSRAAKGNIQAGLRLASQDFLNQEALTTGQDSTLFEPFGQFSYRLSSTARALFRLSLGMYNFENDLDDRTEITASTGIFLAEGRKTSGTARIGVTQARFDNVSVQNQNTVTANIALTYLPVSYSRWVLSFQRNFDDSENAISSNNSLQIEDNARLDWEHQWSSRFRTNAFLASLRRTGDCPDLDIQSLSAGLTFGVAVRRWLIVGAGIETESWRASDCPDRSDARENLDYERQQISANMRVTL